MVSTSNPQSFQATNLPNIDQILGIAVFDPQGLPRQYFVTTAKHQDDDWIRLAFQALGLKQLLMDEMELPQLDHVMMRTKTGNLVILPYAQGFIALHIKRALPQEQPNIDNHWTPWACNLIETVIKQDSRFKAV